MPNWCQNNVIFSHENPTMITKIVNGIRGTGLFKELVPPPADIDYENDWYAWNIENWSTKWDVIDKDAMSIYNEGDTEVCVSFDTAWNPPIEFYNNLVDQGFQIEAYYFESGLGFCGKYVDGDNDYYEIEDIDGKYIPWIESNIPDDIIEEFNMIEHFESWDEEEE